VCVCVCVCMYVYVGGWVGRWPGKGGLLLGWRMVNEGDPGEGLWWMDFLSSWDTQKRNLL
jgi:hypothetical protein